MADDALTRKDAEMDGLTEARLAWARECGRDNLPCPSDREIAAFNEGFRRAQALSLESGREEALEEAKMKCKAISEEGRKNRLLETSKDDVAYQQGIEHGAGSCVAALRALQAAPESPAKEQLADGTLEAACIRARSMTAGIYGGLSRLLDSYVKPCPEKCNHANSLLRHTLYKLREEHRAEYLASEPAKEQPGEQEFGQGWIPIEKLPTDGTELTYAKSIYPLDGKGKIW